MDSRRVIVLVVVAPIPSKPVELPTPLQPRVRITPIPWRSGVLRVERLAPEYPEGTGTVEFVEEWTN